MKPSRTLEFLYVALALVALLACWRQNLLFAAEQQVDLAQGFVAALLANPATASITLDIALLGVAVQTWLIVEGRRLGVRYVWAYVLLGFAIAISVMIPLFLAARERARRARGEQDVALGVGDRVGLVLLGVPAVCFALWSLWGLA